MVRIRWLGHSGFEITIDGKVIIIDPFITENPNQVLELADIPKVDIVAMTHDHFDHRGDSIEIAKRDSATFLCAYENRKVAIDGGIADIASLNIGGSCVVKGIRVICTLALHTGNPCGFIFVGKEGKVYHAGDTGLFGDMALLGELYSPDVVLLPIGGHYTMGPYEAAKAVELLKPKVAIPMHYNTYKVIRQDPQEFKEMVLKRVKTDVAIIKPGQVLEI